MEVIASAIYDLCVTFGFPAEIGEFIAEGLTAIISFFSGLLGSLGDIASGI